MMYRSVFFLVSLLNVLPYAASTTPTTSKHNILPFLFLLTPVDGTSSRSWEEATAKANAVIARLNVTEKATLATGSISGPCSGNIVAIPSIGFSGLCLMDGPLAIRTADLASVFPAGLTAAATWDRDLIFQRGFAMGTEFREKGAHVILG